MVNMYLCNVLCLKAFIFGRQDVDEFAAVYAHLMEHDLF